MHAIQFMLIKALRALKITGSTLDASPITEYNINILSNWYQYYHFFTNSLWIC